MAKVNFDVVLKNMGGKPLADNDGEDLTMARASRNALLVMDDKATGDQKYKHYSLAIKIGEGGVVDLKSDEITTIKESIGVNMFPIVVGPAWDILEGKVPEGYPADCLQTEKSK